MPGSCRLRKAASRQGSDSSASCSQPPWLPFLAQGTFDGGVLSCVSAAQRTLLLSWHASRLGAARGLAGPRSSPLQYGMGAAGRPHLHASRSGGNTSWGSVKGWYLLVHRGRGEVLTAWSAEMGHGDWDTSVLFFPHWCQFLISIFRAVCEVLSSWKSVHLLE